MLQHCSVLSKRVHGVFGLQIRGLARIERVLDGIGGACWHDLRGMVDQEDIDGALGIGHGMDRQR